MNFSEWQAAVLSGLEVDNLSSIEKGLPGKTQTYPLLAEEDTGPIDGPPKLHRWSIRVVTAEPYDGDKKEALLDGGVQVVNTLQQSRQSFEPVESCLDVRVCLTEGRLEVDLNILRNITEFKRVRASHPDVRTWTLVCEYPGTDEPEALVGETVRQMTGVLAGCEWIEIRQGQTESFQSLWGRLNVARLMAFEGELGAVPDAVDGAPFFAELSRRLDRAN